MIIPAVPLMVRPPKDLLFCATHRDEVRDVMLQSIFIPCPRGYVSPDSFRFCEALECGWIPIVEKIPTSFTDYFRGMLDEDYPFPAVADWSEAPPL
jgi:hypothetical protein